MMTKTENVSADLIRMKEMSILDIVKMWKSFITKRKVRWRWMILERRECLA